MKKFLKTLSWGGGNSLKPSISACFEQYSNVKLGARKGAFTLAEVLITLGIIGVVAALTLPALIQKYQDQVLENQLKKMYSTISQGIQKAMADDGVSNFGDTELYQACKDDHIGDQTNDCIQMVKKYFNVVAVKTDRREYYRTLIQIKYGEEYIDGDSFKGREVLGYYRDPSKRVKWSGYLGAFELADGSEFSIGCYGPANDPDPCSITLDTNGLKGPNTDYLDIFSIEIRQKDTMLYPRSRSMIEAIAKNNWKFPW